VIFERFLADFLYQNGFKIWGFGKEAAQILCLEQATNPRGSPPPVRRKGWGPLS